MGWMPKPWTPASGGLKGGKEGGAIREGAIEGEMLGVNGRMTSTEAGLSGLGLVVVEGVEEAEGVEIGRVGEANSGRVLLRSGIYFPAAAWFRVAKITMLVVAQVAKVRILGLVSIISKNWDE